jgi:phosphate transport system permease protein
MDSVRTWIRNGTPWVWLNAAAVSTSILLVAGLLLLIAARGMGHFWPAAVHEIVYQEADGSRSRLAAQVRDRERVKASRLIESGLQVEEGADTIERILLKTANRDLGGQDFRWVLAPTILQQTQPLSMAVLERVEWGMFFGRVVGVKQAAELLESGDVWADFRSMLMRAAQLREQISDLEKTAIGRVNYRMERLRLEQRELQLDGIMDPAAFAEVERQRQVLEAEYLQLESELLALNEAIRRDAVIMETSAGQEVELPLYTVVDAWQPNAMDLGQRLAHYFRKAWSFITDDPREANTEGGIFPAIFGTILMVLLMTVVVAPFGVIAGVYLREYARQGMLTRIIRIAVNNLAGVPSIVYGVFGLGFFVYTLGGSIDRLFYEAALPSPTFGTGGLFWASLTLALLTLPVVIVSTEEGLSRIPRSIREGSLALGATQWETLQGGRRSGAADAGRCGQAGAVAAAGRQLSLPAPRA